MIIRKSNWPEILLVEVAAAKDRPFAFGSHDCCMFSSSLVLAYTGVDPAKKLRGYKSAIGASRMLKEQGKGTLLRTMTAVMKEHGCPRATHVALLKRGDICMTKIQLPLSVVPGGVEEWAVGICLGEVAVFASDGVVYIPMSKIQRGWHCG